MTLDALAFVDAVAAGRRDFRNTRIPRLTLHAAELIGCDFSGSRLAGSTLSECRLDGARFVEADLRRSRFSGASLVGGDLRGADLRAADMRDADLRRADLRDADLRGADFRGALVDTMGISLACRSFVGTRLDGATLRRLLGLLAQAELDDPELTALLQGASGLLPAAEEGASAGRSIARSKIAVRPR